MNYEEVFNQGRKAGITITINESIAYHVRNNGWEFSEENVKKIAILIVSKFHVAIGEAALNEKAHEELIKEIEIRVKGLIRKQKKNKPTESQERFYLALLERTGETGKHKERQIDIAIEIDRLSEKVKNGTPTFYIRDNSHLQALRMKHYEGIIINEKLFPYYYKTFNIEERNFIETYAQLAMNKYSEEEFNKIGQLAINFSNWLALSDVEIFKPYQLKIKKDISVSKAIIYEMAEIFKNNHLNQMANNQAMLQ